AGSGSGEPAHGKASGSGEPAAPRRQSLLRSQARCALLPAATPRVRATAVVRRVTPSGGVAATAIPFSYQDDEFRVGGACGPPPPVAAPLASSLRAPSRGAPRVRATAI